MTISRNFQLYDESAYQVCMNELAPMFKKVGALYLSGPLGAGKTTWVRYLLRSLGYEGVVRSPTYTLFEVYELPNFSVVHVDCYRMQSADEVALSGLDQYIDHALCCFEWPELVANALPDPTWSVQLEYLADGLGRRIYYQVH